jgi:hypothetical protein
MPRRTKVLGKNNYNRTKPVKRAKYLSCDCMLVGLQLVVTYNSSRCEGANLLAELRKQTIIISDNRITTNRLHAQCASLIK